MLSFLKKVFAFIKVEKPSPEPTLIYTKNDRGETLLNGRVISQYPPFLSGFSAIPSEGILMTQSKQVDEIFNALEFSREEFDRLVIPVLKNFISYAHLLPASESNHHRLEGGLVHHCLEVAYNAAQISRSHIFATGKTVREKRDNEERWRVAAMLAGLFHDVAKPATDYTVTAMEGELVWDPVTGSLESWLIDNHIDRYFLLWKPGRHKEHEGSFLSLFAFMMTLEMKKYLGGGNSSEIYNAIEQAVSGRAIHKPLARIMMEADQASVINDLKRHKIDTSSSGFGIPVDRYIFDAVRELIKSKDWTVNQHGSRVWYIKGHGAFVDLIEGSNEIYAHTRKQKVPGIPRSSDVIADLLIERCQAIASPTQTDDVFGRYWDVSVSVTRAGMTANVTMKLLKLISHELIFLGEPPVAITGSVRGTDEPEQPQEQPQAQEQPAAPINKKTSADKLPTDSESPDEAISTTGKPRDFDKLMGDLADIEGEHQPDLQPKAEGEGTPDTEEKPDAVSALVKQLSGQVRAERGESPEPEALAAESSSPQTTLRDIPNAESKPIANDEPIKPDAEPAAPQSSIEPKPARRKARPKSAEEEAAISAKKAAISAKKAERNPLIDLSPEAMKARIKSSQKEAEPVNEKPTLTLLQPSTEEELALRTYDASKSPSTEVRLKGPGPSTKHKSSSVVVTEKPKEPRQRKENRRASRLRSSGAGRNTQLDGAIKNLLMLFPELAPVTAHMVSAQLMSVLNRDIPMGVTILNIGDALAFEAGVIPDSAIKDLLANAQCKSDSSGRVLLGEKLSSAISNQINIAQNKADTELNREVTENVTNQHQQPD